MTEIKKYMKRLYAPSDFFRLLSDMVLNLKDMREAGKAGRVDKEFSERIMMAVTEVNGCRYCSYFHTQAALKAGMQKSEIDQILEGEFKDAPREEIAALNFAQHYAESGGKPNLDAVQYMRDSYGNAMTKNILAYIRAIMIGNAWGNMFDALRMRFKGNPSGETSLMDELSVVFGIFWMMLVLFIKKIFKNLSRAAEEVK